MCSNPRHLTNSLNAALKVAGLPHHAVYVPAEDFESEDDEIELRVVGAPINLAVQVGPYGAGLNEYLYKNGHLHAVRHVRHFDQGAAMTIVAAVIDELKKRAA